MLSGNLLGNLYAAIYLEMLTPSCSRPLASAAVRSSGGDVPPARAANGNCAWWLPAGRSAGVGQTEVKATFGRGASRATPKSFFWEG